MSLAGLALALTLSVSPRADGVEESPPPPEWILTVDPSLAPLWTALEAEEHPDRLWTWGWAGFFGTVIVGQSIIAATTSNEGNRINAYVNIPASAAGLLAVLLLPPAAGWGLEDIRRMPEETEAQRTAKASALRGLFDRSVEQQRFYRSPLNHVIGLTVNAGLAALLYFGWKLGGRALLVLISGTISWEVQIFTRPTAALDLATARSESALGGLHVVPLPTGSRSPERSEQSRQGAGRDGDVSQDWPRWTRRALARDDRAQLRGADLRAPRPELS